jgi:3-oxoacyl-[acyl-carrier protein] reductase
MRFAGKVAVVTGAGGGLGAAYAAALAREGALVALVDTAVDPIKTGSAAIESTGGKALAIACDLRNAPEVESMVDAVVAAFGRLDILINNAGGGSSTPGNASSIVETTPDAWDAMLGVNLSTAFLPIRAVAPVMKRQRYGRIVNVSSRSARVADPKLQQSPSYATAKTAILGLTRFAARELGPFQITVNCLVPALVLSGPVLEDYWDQLGEAARDEYLAQVALKRLPDMDEITAAVLFLCSDDASYITGVALDVNGGSFMPA